MFLEDLSILASSQQRSVYDKHFPIAVRLEAGQM